MRYTSVGSGKPETMFARNSAARPWKILIFAVLACAVACAIAIGMFVHFVSSFWHAHNNNFPRAQTRSRTAVAQIDRDTFLRLAGARDPGASNGNASPNAFKNAILATQNSNARTLPGDDLFRDALVPTLKITLPSQSLSSLNRSPRKYVRATVQEGRTTYTNVAIRLKGGPGSYRPLQDQPSLTVNFDKFAEGQTFHGLKKIHLNSSVQDRSLVSEKISRELFEAAGVPVPRAGNAKVIFDSRELGVYVLVEGVNKQFLKRYFKDAKGNVYDGHSGSDVTDDLPTNSGENPRDKSALRTLARAAREPDLSLRATQLEQALDVDRFISFVAMETILAHWDGYTMNRNNYRIFHDRESGRLVFIPQGLDQVLSRPRGTIFPPTVGLVARAVLEVPALRHRYRERFAELATNVFRSDAISARVVEVAQNIEAALEEDSPEAAAAHRERATGFLNKVRRRADTLAGILVPVEPVKFDAGAAVQLTHWSPKRDLGEAVLEQEKDPTGKQALRISTRSGCTASWRTTAVLDSGTYQLEGRIKTKGVVFPKGDSRAGAGLRISGYRVGQKNDGDRDWTPVTFEFEVPDDQSEIELVCELRASSGDLWIDLNSLKLRRQ